MGTNATRLDLSKYDPMPLPPADSIERAATVLFNLSQVGKLDGWEATFKMRTLEFTGVWPEPDENLDEIRADIQSIIANPLDADMRDAEAMCRLEIRHAFERANLMLMHMRERLEECERLDAPLPRSISE